MIGASFFLAASRHALIPEEETQFTAGMAYPTETMGSSIGSIERERYRERTIEREKDRER